MPGATFEHGNQIWILFRNITYPRSKTIFISYNLISYGISTNCYRLQKKKTFRIQLTYNLLISLSDNQMSYSAIGFVCALILIGLIIVCLAFSLYKTWKQRKAIVINTPNQDVNDAVSFKSSPSSIYYEIEFYESARTERAQLTSSYTVTTRDPYAYDEIFGL